MANEYKVSQNAESISTGSSVKTKYSDVFDLFIAALADDDSSVLKRLPRKKEQITKQILTSKLKAVRLKYRQVVDSGRRSAGMDEWTWTSGHDLQ